MPPFPWMVERAAPAWEVVRFKVFQLLNLKLLLSHECQAMLWAKRERERAPRPSWPTGRTQAKPKNELYLVSESRSTRSGSSHRPITATRRIRTLQPTGIHAMISRHSPQWPGKAERTQGTVTVRVCGNGGVSPQTRRYLLACVQTRGCVMQVQVGKCR